MKLPPPVHLVTVLYGMLSRPSGTLMRAPFVMIALHQRGWSMVLGLN